MKHELVLAKAHALALRGSLEPKAEVAPDDPVSEVRLGLIVAVLFFILLLGWAALTPLDAAAQGEGRVSVSGQRQSVQHRDGGIVGALLVREGQKVQKGQVLIRLTAPETLAQERALSSQYIGLLAQRARLKAEQFGQKSIASPPEFSGMSGADLAEAQSAMRLEAAQMATRASLLAAQEGAIGQQGAQLDSEAAGYSSQVAAAREQKRLLDEELSGLRSLAAKGFVSKNRIRALERSRAELVGQQGSYHATIQRSREAKAEAHLRMLELQRTQQDTIAKQLREVDTAVGDVYPRLSAARDQLSRTSVRAPEAGTIVGLSVFTVGGVIAPGQRLMDIVPAGASLVIEAKVSPKDIDDIHVGQEAKIRLVGLHERSIPNLSGRISLVSADSFTDEKTGASYFTVDVTIPPKQVEVLRRLRGKGFNLHAGMPAQVLIPVRKRTVLQYALEPLLDALWMSFREQ